MKIKVRFPVMLPRNYKAIREQILLDTYGQGFEQRIVAAAEAVKSRDQVIIVRRTFTAKGRFSVRIEDNGSGDRMARRKNLQSALGRVSGAL